MKVSESRRTRRAGFTLTEMLIVLAILVMLMALVVPRFMGARKKADLQAAQTQIGLFRGALENYYLDVKSFPTTEQGLQALIEAPAESEEGATAGWNGSYVNKDVIGQDPWHHDYQYAYPPERGSTDFPDIWSFGPDGEDNTEDDICSWTVKSGEEGVQEPGQPKENRDIDIDVKVGGPGGGPGGGGGSGGPNSRGGAGGPPPSGGGAGGAGKVR